ncbi:hypothetical protein BG004_001918 [Podila humilis]|nr:hypothetical protein BG004_001918 [Podila humilis]
MSSYDIRNLKRLQPAEANAPRKLRERRYPIPASVVKIHQDAVFGIPELMMNVAGCLSKRDLRTIVQVCRAWFQFFAPILYNNIELVDYTCSTAYPKLLKYGPLVNTLRIRSSMSGVIRAITHTSNLRNLEVTFGCLNRGYLDRILSALPVGESEPGDHITHLSLLMWRIPSLSSPSPPQAPTIDLISQRAFKNLQHLCWRMTSLEIHVNELLELFQACLQLTSLELLDAIVVDKEEVYTASPVLLTGMAATAASTLSEQLPELAPAIPASASARTCQVNTDPERVYSGRKLQKLGLHRTIISDETLLRLLGINDDDHHRPMRVQSKFSTTDHSSYGDHPALTHLTVISCQEATHRSAALIMRECGQLQSVYISRSKMASVKMFDITEREWKARHSIKSLDLDLQRSSPENPLVDYFTPLEQQAIMKRLESMVVLKELYLNGTVLKMDIMDKMNSLVNANRSLEIVRLEVAWRNNFARLESESEMVMATKVAAWIERNNNNNSSNNNPSKWTYQIPKVMPSWRDDSLLMFDYSI